MCFTESLKNQNKNFVKTINHEYFGGSDVTNVSKNRKKNYSFPALIQKLVKPWVP